MTSVFILISAIVLSGLSSPSAIAQAPQKIRIGYPSISSRQAQLWVAKDEGIFRKYGLDVELFFSAADKWRSRHLPGAIPH